ncbi:MAG TPA: leucyl aminopeptidase [Candidatus Binatia bacterium]|nr:leucyl aminopeptidase [Candidatus Binatia bacterium]
MTSGPSVRVVRGGTGAARADLLVLPVAEGGLRAALRALPGAQAQQLAAQARRADFRGRADELLVRHAGAGAVALVGLGEAPEPDAWRRAGARGRREAQRQGAARVAVYLGSRNGSEILQATAEGFLLAGYRFDRYRGERPPERVTRVTFVGDAVPDAAEARERVRAVEAVVAQVFAARDAVNEPPSVATPRHLAAHARRLAAAVPGLTVEVWNRARIAREGLSGLLAVARGSHEEPRFIMLHHAPRRARRRVALVGKGISFDSGGLSLKPAKSMETMKYDMAAGAAVLSAAAAAAAIGLPVEVTAYVPVTENMPGGGAQKPGDVIRYANGKTVEVLNTDAEGRLVLADALLLAGRGRPDALIDLATLTGAARVALGTQYAAVFGTDQQLVDALLAAGRTSGERLWQLPLVPEYREDLKSPVADLRNIGGGDAGTIVAAVFLQQFVDAVPWAHVDIAATAFAEKDVALGPRGATGFGVRLLVEYLRAFA